MHAQDEFIEVTSDEAKIGVAYVASEHRITLHPLTLHRMANLTRSKMAAGKTFEAASQSALKEVLPPNIRTTKARRKAYLQGVGKIFADRRETAQPEKEVAETSPRPRRRNRRKAYEIVADQATGQLEWAF